MMGGEETCVEMYVPRKMAKPMMPRTEEETMVRPRQPYKSDRNDDAIDTGHARLDSVLARGWWK